jgi:hypothetical protein
MYFVVNAFNLSSSHLVSVPVSGFDETFFFALQDLQSSISCFATLKLI